MKRILYSPGQAVNGPFSKAMQILGRGPTAGQKPGDFVAEARGDTPATAAAPAPDAAEQARARSGNRASVLTDEDLGALFGTTQTKKKSLLGG